MHFQQTLAPIVKRLLLSRGFDQQAIAEFLSADLKALPDFSKLNDLEEASRIIIEAISSNKKIGIYGDYDVDGSTSCALLFHFFKLLGVTVELFQPSRFVEGYGLHVSSIEDACSKDIDILITVDCGITSLEAATYAKERGVGLIITDHHSDITETPPEALAIVNPNRRDQEEEFPLRSLAGVGVAFVLAVQVRKDLLKSGKDIPSIYSLLQFVAVGSIADLARMNPVNLKLVRHGLSQLKSSKYPGLQAFFTPEERRSGGIVLSEKISFGIAPLINSKGRLGHPEKGLKLLALEEGEDGAFPLYSQLEVCNNERKKIQKDVYDEAFKQVLKQLDGVAPIINIVYSKDWHEGVIGIVASKLVETFKVPAICLTNSKDDGVIKGSVRSAGELDIFSELSKCQDLFLKFGGHKAAAGLSLEKNNLPELKNRLKNSLEEIPFSIRTEQDYFDMELAPSDITPTLVKSLEMMEPFGIGNKKPLFRIRDLQLDSFDLMKEVHVRWNFSDKNNPKRKLKGISFNYVGKWGLDSPEITYSRSKEEGLLVYGTVSINKFRGNEYLQLHVNKLVVGLIN